MSEDMKPCTKCGLPAIACKCQPYEGSKEPTWLERAVWEERLYWRSLSDAPPSPSQSPAQGAA